MVYHHLQGKQKRERERKEKPIVTRTPNRPEEVGQITTQLTITLFTSCISQSSRYSHCITTYKGKKREKGETDLPKITGVTRTLNCPFSEQLGVLVTPVILGHLWLMMVHSKRICTTYDACFQFLSCSLPETPTADIQILEWE